MATANLTALYSSSHLFTSNPPKSYFSFGLPSPRKGKSFGRLLLFSHANNLPPICCLSLSACRKCNFLHFFPVKKEKGTSMWHHPLSVKPSTVTQFRNRPVRIWRPTAVKSGEMEGSPSNEGILVDEQTLQRDLERAIKEENYALAAKLRDDLQLLHEDSKASVLAANTRFYNAFRNGDFVAMRSIWAKGDNVCCVHPGSGAISGYDLVISSWEIICGAEHEFPIMIDLRNVEVHVRGDVGYVTCLEVVKTKGSSWGRQVATNVFERVDGQWLMCIHHASHVDM